MTCGGCAFWQKVDGGEGECRRHPPVTGQAKGFREWPRTRRDDWCGEWAERLRAEGDNRFKGAA